MLSLTKRCETFTKENTFLFNKHIDNQNEINNIIFLKDKNINRVFHFPICDHYENNITFELENNTITICGCLDCVSKRNFTWGSSSIPDGTCLDFKEHENTINGKFPCNGAVDGRELTNEELIVRTLNRIEWQYIQKNNFTPNTWLLKDISSLKEKLPERCYPILKNIIGEKNFNSSNHKDDHYIINYNDIDLFNELAQVSVNGILPPHINQESSCLFTNWERNKIKGAQLNYQIKNKNKNKIKNKNKNKNKNKKELACYKAMNIIETIQNDISKHNYIQLCQIIQSINDL